MDVLPFLRNQPFDPDLTDALSAAFVEACAASGVSDYADATAQVVASHVITGAQRGMRTKSALYLNAVWMIKANRH